MHSVFLPLALPGWKPGGGIEGIGNLSKLLYAPMPPIELKCMFEWEKTLLIHLGHKQVVVDLILGLLLLLRVELWELTERHDGRIDPIGVAVVET